MERRTKPWTDVARYYARETWPILLAAVTTFLPLAGYARASVWLVCGIALAVVTYHHFTAHKNRQFSRRLRMLVWLTSILLIVGGGFRLSRIAMKIEVENEAKIARAEFLAMRERRIREAMFEVGLNRAYHAEELGNFGFFSKSLTLTTVQRTNIHRSGLQGRAGETGVPIVRMMDNFGCRLRFGASTPNMALATKNTVPAETFLRHI